MLVLPGFPYPQDITRLLSLAGSSISLLTLPQTDAPADNLPQGEERSEQFVLEVSEYFERLDVSSTLVLNRSFISCQYRSIIYPVHPERHPILTCAHSACSNSALCHQRACTRLRSSFTWRGAPQRGRQARGDQSRIPRGTS